MAMNKASQIVQEEYSCLNNADAHDTKFVDHADTNLKTDKLARNMKASLLLKREREICAVSEYFYLCQMTTEVPGRQFDNASQWSNIDLCTVDLISETDKECGKQMIKESQTNEEQLLDKITDDIFDQTESNAGNAGNAKDADANEDKIDGSTIDPELLANLNEIDRDEDENVEETNETKIFWEYQNFIC